MPTTWGGRGEGGSAVDFSKARQGLQASKTKKAAGRAGVARFKVAEGQTQNKSAKSSMSVLFGGVFLTKSIAFRTVLIR